MFYPNYSIGGELQVHCTMRCGYCDNTHVQTCKVAPGGELPVEWEIPSGWSLLNDKYVCDRHKIEVKDAEKTVKVLCACCREPFECTWDQYRKGRKYCAGCRQCRHGMEVQA